MLACYVFNSITYSKEQIEFLFKHDKRSQAIKAATEKAEEATDANLKHVLM